MRGVGDCDDSRGAGGGDVMLSELDVGVDGYSALVVPLCWACCAQYLVLAQVAQLATTTCATYFILYLKR